MEKIDNEIINEITKYFGTPVYVYFESIIKDRVEQIFEVFKGLNFLPTFALKANNNPNIINILRKMGFGADVISLGELYAAKLAGVDKEKIIWNGNGKTKELIEKFKNEVKYVNVDSFEEMEKWKETKADVELFVRINPDVDSKTHPHISTGLKTHKFGIYVDMLDDFFAKFKDKRIKGFHVHIGSQITDVKPFKEAFEITKELSYRYGFEEVNIGGGWGINYRGKELNINEYKNTILPILRGFKKILIEIGRFIIGPAGILVAKVLEVKRSKDKYFITLDAGMNLLIRPALYNAYHRVHFLECENEKIKADIVGPLCETGDVFVKNEEICKPKAGSLAYIENAGAYGFSMSSHYNSFPKPAEVLVLRNNDFVLIRKCENVEDIFNNVILIQ